MIVIDVNILFYFLHSGQHTVTARDVYEHDSDWIAPTLIYSEFQNILASNFRRGFVSEWQCLEAWRESLILLENNVVDPDWEVSLALALKHQITSYDSQYVEVARARRLPLVTEDRELLRKFPGIAISMVDFIRRNGNSSKE